MNGCTTNGYGRSRSQKLVGTLTLLLALLLLAPAQAGPDQAAKLFDLGHHDSQAGTTWNTGIYSTTFAVSSNVEVSGMGHVLQGKSDCFVALPAVKDGLGVLNGRMMSRDKTNGLLTCRVIEIRPHGRSGPVVEATVEDIGPWCISDPYWVTGERPNAEDGADDKGRKTNRAGIDISPALCKALGVSRSSRVDWRFKTDANGNILTRTRQEKFRT